MQTSLVRCQSSVMRAGPRLPQRVVHARVKLVVRASQGFDPIRLGDSVDSASTPEQVAKNMGLTGPMGANKPINVGPNTTLSGASAMGTANMGTGPGLSGMDRARNVPGSNVSGGVTPAAFERARADAGPPGGVGDGPGFSRGDGGGSGKGSGGSGGGGGGSGGSGGGKGRPSGEGFGGNLVLALGGMALITAAVMLYKAFQPSETQRVDMLVEKADKASAKAQSAAVEVKSKAAAKLEQARQLEFENNERAAQAKAAQAEAKVHAMSAKVGSAASQASDVAHNVEHKMERAKDAVGDKAHAAGQEARGIFSSIKHSVGNAAHSVAGGAESAENKVKGTVQGGVDKVKGSVKGGVDKVKGKVSKVKAEAKDTKGFKVDVETPDKKSLVFWGTMAAGITTAATATGCLIAYIVKNREQIEKGIDKAAGKAKKVGRDAKASVKDAASNVQHAAGKQARDAKNMAGDAESNLAKGVAEGAGAVKHKAGEVQTEANKVAADKKTSPPRGTTAGAR